MKLKVRYLIYFIIALILITIIPDIYTNAKYYTKISIDGNVEIGAMIFSIKPENESINAYDLKKGENITVNYKLSNKDSQNNINKMELKYYIKILDSNNSEDLLLQTSIDRYEYIKYNVDEKGNIINEDGNIVDENGNIIKEQELTDEENEELQNSLTQVKKGYGVINLCYDGETEDEEIISINLKCPENYTGAKKLNYTIKLIAEGIVDKTFTAEESVDLIINIVDEEESSEETNTSETKKALTKSTTTNEKNSIDTTDNTIENSNVIENSIITNSLTTTNTTNAIDNTLNVNNIINEIDTQNKVIENVTTSNISNKIESNVLENTL